MMDGLPSFPIDDHTPIPSMKTPRPALHAVQHDLATHCWCGLAAFSIITGKPTSAAKKAIIKGRRSRDFYKRNPKHRKLKVVKGTSNRDLMSALEVAGYTCGPITRIAGQAVVAGESVHKKTWTPGLGWTGRPKTVAMWMSEMPLALAEKVVVLSAGHHWIVAHDYMLADNQSKVPVLWRDFPRKRYRCAEYFTVTRKKG